jgi:hypothetical protein
VRSSIFDRLVEQSSGTRMRAMIFDCWTSRDAARERMVSLLHGEA